MKKIVLFFCFWLSNAVAGEKIGAWEVIIASNDDYQLAKTENNAGGVAGVLCFISSKSCNAYFATDIPCDEGAKYPIMMSAISGSMNVQANCIRYGKNKFLVLDNMSAIIDAFEDGGEVAFVMPMKENKFIVSRFNCVGAKSAIRKATSLLEIKPQSNSALPQLLPQTKK